MGTNKRVLKGLTVSRREKVIFYCQLSKIPSRPNKNPHDLIELCISYLFGIVQSSVTLGGVNECSSWSTSIWVTRTMAS